MPYFVFFSGLPKSYPQQGIRDLFSRCGNVVSLRIARPHSSSSSSSSSKKVTDSTTQSGLIEYADEASQQAAIALFNGYVIDTPRGQVRIRVGASKGFGGSDSSSSSNTNTTESGRIRGRDDQPSSSSSSYKHEKFIDSDLSTSEHLILNYEEKKMFYNNKRNNNNNTDQQQQDGSGNNRSSTMMMRRSTFDPLQQSLLRAPEHELREAIEQLRVLCAEQPDRARMLLDTFPQLRRAVCMILQSEGKLPVPLPPEAFVEKSSTSSNANNTQTNNNTNSNEKDSTKVKEDDSGSNDSNNKPVEIDAAEQEQIQNIINELSPEALQEMLTADFDSQEGQMEESVRQHFIKIQKQLRAMAEEE